MLDLYKICIKQCTNVLYTQDQISESYKLRTQTESIKSCFLNWHKIFHVRTISVCWATVF